MPKKVLNNRVADSDIDSMFLDRWSPRGFLPDSLSDRQIKMLFEAARWAPSCYNEQPWVFLYAKNNTDREKFLSLLVDKNRRWAKSAPLLIFIMARKQFEHGDRENRHAVFDAGAAWISLAFQARKLGLYAHAMAGFKAKKAYEVLNVPEEKYQIMAAIAVGYKENAPELDSDLLDMESPNERKPITQNVFEGEFS